MPYHRLALVSAVLFGISSLAQETVDRPRDDDAPRITINRQAVLPVGAPQLENAIVYVTIEDTTELDDGEPGRIARLELHRLSTNGGPIKFTLGPIAPPSPDVFFNIRVHVDLDRDGEISQGDYLSLGRYSAFAQKGEGPPIRLQLVR